ncbi:unnamed protein product [Alternaria alternata]
MAFWSSVREPVAAAKVLHEIGQGFSKLEETGELVKQHTDFLERLEDTFKAVNKSKKDGIVPQALQDNVKAISAPLRKAEVDMLEFMGLNEDDLILTPDIKSSTSRIFWRTMYHEEFSRNITNLRDEVAIPLLGLHTSLATMCSQNRPITKKEFERWAAASKRFIDKRLVQQTKEWLRPVCSVEEKYQAYIDNISLSNCEWFFSKQEYIHWYTHLSKKGSPMLLISGIVGAGRTQIAARVVQKLREDRRTVAYVFCGIGTITQGTIRDFIVTLCWELLNQFPEDIELLSENCNKDGEPTETEIQDCLQRMCERRKAIILLDGLNECSLNEQERGKLCQFLASSNDVCDIIIFSQELEDIKLDLSKHDSIPHISNCEADFWNEIEKIPTRYAAGLRTSDEKMKQGVDGQVGSDAGIEEKVVRFPRSREDQCQTYTMLLHRASRSSLPTHIAVQIIEQAEYLVKSTFERHGSPEINGDEARRNIPYLLSDPIEGGRYSRYSRYSRHSPIRKIIATCKHDQTWSEFPGPKGSYEDSSKYFDLIVRKADGSIRNISLHHRLGTLSGDIQSGDRIGVVPKAITPGLVNFVKIVRIEIFSTFIPNEEYWDDRIRRQSHLKREKKTILARIRNSTKQTLSSSNTPGGTEQGLPNTGFEKKMQLSNPAGDYVPLLQEQNLSLPPSDNGKPIHTESTHRNPGSSISSYSEDADQLEPNPIFTTSNDLDEQTHSDYTDRKDENTRSSISIGFVQMIRKLLRPGVRPGYRRLEWTCTCGESLYGDYEEKTPGSLDEFAARLKQQSGPSSQHGAPASIPQPKKVYTGQAKTVANNMLRGGSSNSNNANNLISNVAGSSGHNAIKPPIPTSLQLCIKTGKYKLVMSQLARPNSAVSDGELFAMIRQQYERTRRSILPTWARFKTPARAIFVEL